MSEQLPDVDPRKFTEAYNKVLYWFYSFPKSEWGLNELVDQLSISKTTANKVVEQMLTESILKRKIYGRTWRISINTESDMYTARKIPYNLDLVYDAYRNGLRDAILKVVGNCEAVVLFGSYRKGDDTEESDIDLAVEIHSDNELQVHYLGDIGSFGYRKNVPVNLHIFTRNKVDINMFANIANGIVLEGFLEVRP